MRFIILFLCSDIEHLPWLSLLASLDRVLKKDRGTIVFFCYWQDAGLVLSQH